MSNFFTIPQYTMVLVNLIALGAFSLGFIFFRYIYPKKKVNFLLILLILSILPLISILRPGPYESGDFLVHTQIAMGFDQSLREGNILPRWNDNSCGGFGCPDFIFLFVLPYYLISMIHFVGFSFIASLKIFLILSFIGSGLTMYLWLRENFGMKSAFIGSIFYLYAPYHLVNLHFRTDIGEVLSFAIYPLLFLFTKKLADTGKLIYSILFALSATLLLLSHTTMFYSAIPLVSIYFTILWLQKKQRRNSKFLLLFFSLLITLLLSIFYWLPLIYQSRFINYGISAHVRLHSIGELLYSPWRFGLLFQGHHGELSYLIGYAQLLLIFLSIYFFIKHKMYKKNLLYRYFLFSILILSFLTLKVSSYIWQSVPFMDKFEDSHRLLLPINFFISGITGLISVNIKRDLILQIFCFLAITMTILNWGNRRTLPKVTDMQLRNESRIDANGHHSIAPIWVDIAANWSLKRPEQPLEAIQGQIKVSEIKRTTNLHSYYVRTKSSALVKENTYYFPGWTVFVDGKGTKVNFKNNYFPGLIVFKIPPGRHRIDLVYKNIEIQKISNIISLFTVGCIMLYIINKFVKLQKREKNKHNLK